MNKGSSNTSLSKQVSGATKIYQTIQNFQISFQSQIKFELKFPTFDFLAISQFSIGFINFIQQ